MENEKIFKFDISELNINPLLMQALLDMANEEIIIEKLIEKSENKTQFVNCLISALTCILDRERRNNEMIKQLLNSNPQIKEILRAKQEIIEGEENLNESDK